MSKGTVFFFPGKVCRSLTHSKFRFCFFPPSRRKSLQDTHSKKKVVNFSYPVYGLSRVICQNLSKNFWLKVIFLTCLLVLCLLGRGEIAIIIFFPNSRLFNWLNFYETQIVRFQSTNQDTEHLPINHQ